MTEKRIEELKQAPKIRKEQLMNSEENFRKNSEWYDDPTSYQALSNIEREEYKSYERFNSLLKTIFYICEMAGFRVEGRIVLKDKTNGRVWK